ncbi:MAG: GlsB/YeaQ/YmgE family stress response membrane protein [Saprospiraceae bacterium]
MDWYIFQVIVIGAICGYVASRILGGDGFGLLGNIFVGVVGGWIGNELVKHYSFNLPGGIVGRLICTIGGAIILIVCLELLKKLMGTSNRSKRR